MSRVGFVNWMLDMRTFCSVTAATPLKGQHFCIFRLENVSVQKRLFFRLHLEDSGNAVDSIPTLRSCFLSSPTLASPSLPTFLLASKHT